MTKTRTQENTRKKQDYVAQLVKDDRNISMNAAGKKVQSRFGTQLAYDRLREAFKKAGGKIDSRRGPKKGSKRKKSSAKGGAKKYGRRSPEATRKKQDFVAELVKGNSDITMNEAGKRVKAKFGTQLAFKNLKEAFTGAGGKVGKPGRRKGSRGAAKRRRVGRRASDRRAARTRATLTGMPDHVVIIRAGNDVETSEFSTKTQAIAFARSQVLAGTPVSDISYYLRQPLEISVGI